MITSLFTAATLAAQPLATASTEMLSVNVPDEFVMGHHQRNGQIEIAELVRPPETVNNWSTLVTSLMFFGAADRLEAFYRIWRDGLLSKCRELEGQTRRGRVDGHVAIQVAFSCSSTSASMKPETFTAFVVRGDANIMIAQVAFRGESTLQDAALIERVKKSLKVCNQRSLEACEQREASGFNASR